MHSTLQERIKERMEVLGITNAQLAKAQPPTSFNWASGKTKNIKGSPLLLAAKILEVTPEWLASGIGSKYPAAPTYQLHTEEKLAVLPDPKQDRLTTELISLFSQLDQDGKQEYLSYPRGFVAGRRPHPVGNPSAIAG